ncbi:hypothetical protein PM082_008297 [Marasmius tenuissimus]|nr:hypothetical protein PM082_008297 [Marasmius tenuissimus]
MSDLLTHRIHKDLDVKQFDVCIAGSGPIGAAVARQLVDNGRSVVMVEIGDQDTRIPGAHKKNEIEFQKDIDRFVKVIQGVLSTVSIPVSSTVMPTLDPSAWTAEDPKKQIISNGRNPFQAEHNHLGAQAVTRGVGGMSTHWTCATPEFLKRNKNDGNKEYERPVIFTDTVEDDAEWKTLYDAARSIIGTSETEYDESVRHNIVLKALQDAYPNRGIKALPLACHRLAEGSPYVQWHAADNVFGDMFEKPDKKNAKGVQRGKFALLTNTRVTKLHLKPSGNTPSIALAEVKDLLSDRLTPDSPETNYAINAKTFVVAAGAVATPQILANSGFGGYREQSKIDDKAGRHAPLIPNLALRITEQPMAFCQIVLRKELIDDAGNTENKPKWWKDAVEKHKQNHRNDPLPIPFQDGEPQVTIPASYERPWHTQIHRDAFSYGEAGPRVDSRVVVDLRFFGRQHGVTKNKMIFENTHVDAYGMPQPTFEYEPSREYALETSRMMNDMTDVANKLGGYLPGSYPQFMTPGLALHLAGTTRVGRGDQKGETVADYNSQVWEFDNLYVGGNGLIPTAFGANPTLTSICLAIRAAYKINKDLDGQAAPPDSSTPLQKTPDDWVKWTKDESDPNFPNHRKLREPHRRV